MHKSRIINFRRAGAQHDAVTIGATTCCRQRIHRLEDSFKFPKKMLGPSVPGKAGIEERRNLNGLRIARDKPDSFSRPVHSAGPPGFHRLDIIAVKSLLSPLLARGS